MKTEHEHTTPGASAQDDEQYHYIKVSAKNIERIEHFEDKGYEVDKTRTRKSQTRVFMRILKSTKERLYQESRERRAATAKGEIEKASSKNLHPDVGGITDGEKKTLDQIASRLPERDPVVTVDTDDEGEDLSDQ